MNSCDNKCPWCNKEQQNEAELHEGLYKCTNCDKYFAILDFSELEGIDEEHRSNKR